MGIVVAVPNDESLASEIGKRGSQNGITYYDRKMNGEDIVALVPSDVTGKFYAVGEVVSLADIVVISTASIDSLFGEAVIAASLLEKKVIFTDENDISSLLKSIALKEYSFCNRKMITERIISACAEKKADSEELRIDLDKAFPVKGIGTVLLGFVRSGKVKVHDTLQLNGEKEILVRSIQVHDSDTQEAKLGDRVGLAIKGADHEDIEKGDVLSRKGMPKIDSFTSDIHMSPLCKGADIENTSYTLVSGFSVVNCRITKEGNLFQIKLERPAALLESDRFILIRDKSPRILASGKIILKKQ